ncbi:hypothetical protein WJX73_000318 [Symbiochloris irregularis]|uniref:3-hydroxybutyryl-CoA dehydrogenase n=1 Tax=Symbiochloris irregularis TaxID=706552 RepID=A0AAW1P4I9_9CHLO
MALGRLPKLIGVIGAGQLGSGIAQVCAAKALQVVLCDNNEDALDQAMANIKKRLASSVHKGKISTEEATATIERLAPTTHMEDLRDVAIAIEAVPEREDLKRSTFALLDELTSPETILASNTSSISITRIAAATRRPEQVVGMHFMNPVPVMPLVELIRARQTSDSVFMQAKELAEHLGKKVCLSEDRPGFIINRCLMLMLNEAFYLWMEGVATPEDIDRGIKLGLSHAMGPLQLADFIGLDTCLSVIRTLHQELGDSKYRPCPKLVQLVDAGWLGKKTQRGVYIYPAK